eukprot:TRINITY_DN8428_c1_g1_i1.p1 TRINITY_DN8428_c1_g1~~TRINITY_DN8428_c1_g1_i1.p1  ORF type:complete len:290 (-),score=41.66 TRINITY_DN8428_c1_g1_i1:14-883(-)
MHSAVVGSALASSTASTTTTHDGGGVVWWWAITQYCAHVSGGLGVCALFLLFVPLKLEVVRILTYIFTFVLLRDALTPYGVWTIKSEVMEKGVMWLRMSDDPLLLSLLGVGALLLCQLLWQVHSFFYPLGGSGVIVWRINGVRSIKLLMYGIGGGLFIYLPGCIRYLYIPVADRGGPVPLPHQTVLLFFCLSGKLLEEMLFRGYFQGYLQTVDELRFAAISRTRRIMLSGTLFAMMHSYLAASHTSEGTCIVLFTLYQGLISALVRERAGVWASTLAHGLGTYLLCCGL